MISVEWWSQPRAAEGSTASRGIRRQLGKPRLDPLTVLIRETAQNSCDAVLGDGDIRFAVQIRRLSGRRLENWMDFLLPEPKGSRLGIAQLFAADPIVLTISDRGTSGLGGPLRADEIPEPGERSDFVNFIRNVGDRKGGELTGGSYGFGKGILYNVSRCHVVLADSATMFRGQRQRRLIGAALGDDFERAGTLYTGRHWLGNLDGEGVPVPLIDDHAEEWASKLGMPKFDPGETGTSVSIVAADLGSQGDEPRDAEAAANYIVSTMLWNLWPRMLEGRQNRLVCSVSRDGFKMEVPDPGELPLLAPFVDAYQQIADGHGKTPARKSEPRDIGQFQLRHGMAPPWEDEVLVPAAPFVGRAHHCARMRQADLVVDYVAGDPPSNDRLQYGAVFRASAAANEYFAEAEPPTHDEWVLSGLTGTARGVVTLANRFIRTELKSAAAPVIEAPAARSAEPLGHFANQFAGVIAGAEGESATVGAASGRHSNSGRAGARNTVRILERPTLRLEEGHPVIVTVVELPMRSTAKTASAEAFVVTDDGLDSGRDGARPDVLDWTAVDTGRVVVGASVDMVGVSERQWRIRVRPVADTVTRVSVRLRDGNDEA
ncbi:hypothetical protein [Nocardia harenae]|uniref:hypothetical protein n=1 Tax=Nocardia harenae TaxID=358707 RepID=UPI00082AFA61|nr:hypothetical protein [Nocardia harenae]